jgi:quercetin dioxygenase-like cupin family protein
MRLARRIPATLLASTVLFAVFAPATLPQTSAGTNGARSAPPSITRKILQTIEVPGSNYEVIEAKVEIAANSHIPRHTHPGSVSGYVIEGDYSVRLEGQTVKSVAPGESFVIPGGVVHEEFAGARAVSVIAVFVVEKGKPLTTPAP